jgi:hypothetical protein
MRIPVLPQKVECDTGRNRFVENRSGNLKREIVAAVPLYGDTAGRDVIVQQVERPLHVARLVGFRVFL